MDDELEEIENQRFGRTPCNTPFASQQSCSSDSESDDHLVDQQQDHAEVEMCRLQAALLELQAEVSDDEDLSLVTNDSDLPNIHEFRKGCGC
ncbi:hypothetical protein DPMN_166552 [Dreissena polymorpha]|uniref:Uncharacterized protein n=1 Tax=Dreissena polymorpha TaxID=45954 RepID=A0A9D4EYU2_DREPO|nr:hypothetical protein DPMN_166552 [Dreissena polymorpha]